MTAIRRASFFIRSCSPGIALTASLAAAAVMLAASSPVKAVGFTALTLAILLGIAAGNSVFPALAARADAGVDFAKNVLLRAGIVLYGFRISFQQIADVGLTGVLIAALMLGMTFTLAVLAGTRLFKLDRETAMLVGAGSSICGAAAVMATGPVLKGEAHKVAAAVATVVVFGTLAMFAYPLVYPHLHLSEHAYGLFVGSTVHEVAQVVAAGKAVGDHAAETAVIEKMLRVMMLAPFLLLLSAAQSHRTKLGIAGRSPIAVPWFAVLFIAASGINSAHILPQPWIHALMRIDTALLAMAMAALGLRTRAGAVRQAGIRPLLLAGTLFVFLTIGGYLVNVGVMSLLG